MRWRRRDRRPLRTATDVGAATAIGGRAENQDRWFADERLAIVSDGVGGYRGGARAAELSVAASIESLDRPLDPADEAALREAFTLANRRVLEGRVADAELDRMGATLTIAVCADDTEGRWLIGHVGDSPAYLVAPTTTTLLTVEHTAPAQLLAAGAITEEQAATHHTRHMLLRSIGGEPTVEPDLVEATLRPGDALVLCSDGVSDALAPTAIGDLVRGAESADAAATALTDAALIAGATDNVTAVVVRRMASSTW